MPDFVDRFFCASFTKHFLVWRSLLEFWPESPKRYQSCLSGMFCLTKNEVHRWNKKVNVSYPQDAIKFLSCISEISDLHQNYVRTILLSSFIESSIRCANLFLYHGNRSLGESGTQCFSNSVCG